MRLIRPEWGASGVLKAVIEAKDTAPAPDLACAAIRAAADPNNRTPAVIGMTGPHWLDLEHKPRSVPTSELCGICNRPRLQCQSVAAKSGDSHTFEDRTQPRKAAPPPDPPCL